MRSLSWCAPALLAACVVGCSHDAPTASKAPSPAPKAQPDATPAVTAANMVTLHVEGMV